MRSHRQNIEAERGYSDCMVETKRLRPNKDNKLRSKEAVWLRLNKAKKLRLREVVQLMLNKAKRLRLND